MPEGLVTTSVMKLADSALAELVSPAVDVTNANLAISVSLNVLNVTAMVTLIYATRILVYARTVLATLLETIAKCMFLKYYFFAFEIKSYFDFLMKLEILCNVSMHHINSRFSFISRCEVGYYGNPLLGSDDQCKPCMCPNGPGSTRQFADGCKQDDFLDRVICNCRMGYAGNFIFLPPLKLQTYILPGYILQRSSKVLIQGPF